MEKKGVEFKIRYAFDFEFDAYEFIKKYKEELNMMLCQKFGVYYKFKSYTASSGHITINVYVEMPKLTLQLPKSDKLDPDTAYAFNLEDLTID